MRNPRHFWTYAQISLLLELSREGLPLHDIAYRVGKDEEAVKAKAAELGIHLPESITMPRSPQEHLVVQ